MADTYTCELGMGSKGRIDELVYSQRISANSLPEAVARAKRIPTWRHVRAGVNVMRLLQEADGRQELVWTADPRGH